MISLYFPEFKKKCVQYVHWENFTYSLYGFRIMAIPKSKGGEEANSKIVTC